MGTEEARRGRKIMADEKSNEKSETLALLGSLTKAEPVLLVLNLFLGANIALVSGLHVGVLHEKWSVAIETIPVGAAAIFLCLFGLFLTAGIHQLRKVIVEIIYSEPVWAMRTALSKASLDPPRQQLLDSGFVPKELILKKANRESDNYYLEKYQQYEDGIQEEWIVSLHALCAIVLLVFDYWRDRADSIVISVFAFVDRQVAPWSAWLLGIFASWLLVLLALKPIVSMDSGWIHCPGFPDPIDDDVAKIRRATSLGVDDPLNKKIEPPNSVPVSIDGDSAEKHRV